MKTYEPRIDIRLIKSNRRRQIVEGLPVSADRYGKLASIDLTPFLGEYGGVKISKSVREPAGAFSITLTDKPHLAETVYALVEQMDVMIIRMAHDPHAVDFKKGDPDHGLPIVMRGLVTSITRSETISNGKPVRTVTISGHDLGKLLTIFQVHYLNNSAIGDNLTNTLEWFRKYSEDSAAKIMPAKAWIDALIEKVINPFMADILKLADADSLRASNTEQLMPDVVVSGSVSPFQLTSFTDISLYQMMATILDVGPFHELYVDDRNTGSYLVIRPVPFAEVGQGSNPVQEKAWRQSITVKAEDVIAMTVTRDESRIANYFWVSSQRAGMTTNQRQKELAQYASDEQPIHQFKHENCLLSTYGLRKMQVDSSLNPPLFDHTESAREPIVKSNGVMLGKWLAQRRTDLIRMNRDNAIFESGTIRLRGNEAIKAGMFLQIQRGDMVSEYYAHRVEHDFVPYQGFFTTVAVDRGTGFIDRAQVTDAPFYRSMNSRGVS